MLKSIKITSLSGLLLFGLFGLSFTLAAPPQQTVSPLFPYSADSSTYGYVNESGEWVIEPQFDFADDFVEGLAVVAQEGNYGYIDPDGNVVIEPQYTFAADFANGLALVVVDGEFGFIDSAGQTIVEPQFEDAFSFSEGLAAVRPDQNYGYIDESGQFVIEPQFEDAFSFSEGLAAVVDGGQFGFIDETGQWVIAPQFQFASNFSEGLAAVAINNMAGFIDQSGQIVIEPAYDFALDFSEGLAAVSMDGQVGYINSTGRMVIEPQFNFGESFSEGLAAVRIDDQNGYIDATGQMVIEPQFDQANAFEDGLARVEQAYEWGYIKPTGEASFFLPIPAPPSTATTIIPFLPGVPAETRNGVCLTRSINVPTSFAWRCMIETDKTEEAVTTFDPCLIAADGQTLVCGVDPIAGDPGFQVNLLEPLTEVNEDLPDVSSDSNIRGWLVQLADGTICTFVLGVSTSIDEKQANYTCSDGSILVGDLQSGPVWQVEQVALGDITRNDDGYAADQIGRADIDIIWQPVDATNTLVEIGLTPDDVSLDPGSVADTVTAQIRPAIPYDSEISTGLTGEPAHLRFLFDGEDLPEWGGVYPDQAQLLIYPIEAYQAMVQDVENDEVNQRIETLKTLLQDQPATIKGEIPVLPGFDDARQDLQAQVKFLDFGGGSGVRFMTHYSIGAGPITDYDTFYTFQGLTDDGRYYIAYFHPASTDLLPGSFEEVAELIDEDYDAFVDNYETYLQETTETLDQAEATDYTPDLNELDAIIQSIQVR